MRARIGFLESLPMGLIKEGTAGMNRLVDIESFEEYNEHMFIMQRLE